MAQRFKTRGGFILASVGAAVGLGNALRFPGLCAKYGGGTFLMVYLLALVFLGVPLLNAEIALGRKTRGGAPGCMASLFKGGEKVGWAQCANSAITAVIYAGLAGWILAEAFTVVPLCMSGAERGVAAEYFFKSVLKTSGNGVVSSISPLVAVCICAVCAALALCLAGGADSLSAAAKYTVFAPLILLALFSVRGLAYHNSLQALSALFVPDVSRFSSPELWVSALGQVFFSLSLAVGIMPQYGAYLPERCSIFPASLVIAAADGFVSVLASVALFTTLYGCGLQSQISDSGIITGFSVYPAAIVGLFPNRVACGVVGMFFYLSLAMMAVQSGASMLEAAFSPLLDKFNLKRRKSAVICCVFCCLAGMIFATSAADMLVEIADIFINFYNVLALCITECLAIGYSRGGKNLAEEINRYSGKLKMPPAYFKVAIKVLCPVVLIALAAPRIPGLFAIGYPPWAQFAFGWGATLAVISSGFIIDFLSRPRTVS